MYLEKYALKAQVKPQNVQLESIARTLLQV